MPAAAIAAAAWSWVEKMLHDAQRTSDQGLDQNGGLDGHVQGAGNTGALQRLGFTELRAAGHQARHFVFGDLDLGTAPVCELDVFDNVVGHESVLLLLPLPASGL
jgi:ABC-type phosphonate transport system ATPase subunit